MAVTLAQAAATESDPVTRGIIELFAKESAVFDSLPIEPIAGNSYKYDVEAALPGTGFRTVNEAYIESTGVVNQETESLVILGGDADVDKFLVQTSPQPLESLRARQDRMKVRSAQSTFTDALFNGDVDVDPKSFDGLRKRLIGDQVIDSATLVSAANAAFLDELDALFGAVEGGLPDVVYAPQEVVAALGSQFRKVGGAEYILSEITGKRELTWNGVRFVDPGKHWSGRRIMPFNNAAGSDMIAVKWASDFNEVGVMGITNGGVQAYDLGELQEKPAYRTRIEFYCGVAVQGGRAAARLRGIKTK